MPDFRKYAVKVPSPGAVKASDAHELGVFLRDVAKLNQQQRNFRIFGADVTLSDRLNAVFEVTNRQWNARRWFVLPILYWVSMEAERWFVLPILRKAVRFYLENLLK